MEVDRRTALSGLGFSLALGMTSESLAAPPYTSTLAFSAAHTPKPLKFNPGRLEGLSERLITSHWENNYGGSVKALNMIETRLQAALSDKDLPAIVYGDLKREELHRTGSVVLHEIYFGNLGGNGKAGGDIQAALAQAFGSYDAWEAEFRRTAMSLAGGSGWALLALNGQTGKLHNYWMWDHMHAPSAGIPLLALDMYEHSYHMDYGAAAARYVDAFMRNVDWEEVDRRYRRAITFAAGHAKV